MSDVCSITKSTVREVMDEFTRIPLVDGKTFWELDVARDVPSLFEDFACVGRRKVIHYAAFSVGGIAPVSCGYGRTDGKRTDYPRREGCVSPPICVWVALRESLAAITKRRTEEALPSCSFASFDVSFRVMLNTSRSASREVLSFPPPPRCLKQGNRCVCSAAGACAPNEAAKRNT